MSRWFTAALCNNVPIVVVTYCKVNLCVCVRSLFYYFERQPGTGPAFPEP